MEKKIFTIWSNYLDDYFDYKQSWTDAYADYLLNNTELSNEEVEEKLLDEDAIFDFWQETNNDYIDDERDNLGNKQFSRILVIADLGLWYGRRMGYKVCNNASLGDMLYESECDYCKWYVDEEDELRFDGAHHDGNNHYLYRIVKPGVTESQLDNLCKTICEDKDYISLLNKLTTKAGTEVREVYGN